MAFHGSLSFAEEELGYIGDLGTSTAPMFLHAHYDYDLPSRDMIANRVTDIEEGAIFKGFETYEEAEVWFEAHADTHDEIDAR